MRYTMFTIALLIATNLLSSGNTLQDPVEDNARLKKQHAELLTELDSKGGRGSGRIGFDPDSGFDDENATSIEAILNENVQIQRKIDLLIKIRNQAAQSSGLSSTRSRFDRSW